MSLQPSFVLYDPVQMEGSSQVKPIGDGEWDSSMVIANSPRTMDEVWKELALEMPNPSLQTQFQGMAMILGLTPLPWPQTRTDFLELSNKLPGGSDDASAEMPQLRELSWGLSVIAKDLGFSPSRRILTPSLGEAFLI